MDVGKHDYAHPELIDEVRKLSHLKRGGVHKNRHTHLFILIKLKVCLGTSLYRECKEENANCLVRKMHDSLTFLNSKVFVHISVSR